MTRKPELAGQTVVVIGGSSGMGLESARRAREEGAEVILTGRNAEHLKQPRPTSARATSRPSTPPTRPRSGSSSPACRDRSTT